MLHRPLVLAVLVLAAVGCRQTAEERARDDRATAAAEERAREVGTTTITSGEMETSTGAADSGANAFLAEQDDYRVRLRDALDSNEQRSRAAHEPADRVRRRAQRRDMLKRDLELLERSTEATWATARAKIERDLSPSSAPQLPSR